MSVAQLKLNGVTAIKEEGGKLIFSLPEISNTPTNPEPGDFYLGSDGFFKFYREGAFQNLLNTNVGSSENNPFSSCADIANLGLSGIKKMYTTFGGAVDATPVMVDFDTAGGPWIMISFRFNEGGWDGVNDTFTLAGADDNEAISTDARAGSSGDLSLGDGTRRWDEIWTNTSLRNTWGSNSSAYGALEFVSYGVYGPYNVDYYNHAENSLFSSYQITAAQDWVRKLCPLIPHVAAVMDTDSQFTGWAWDQQAYPTDVGGHYIVIKDKDGAYQNVCPTDNDTSDQGVAFIWTENTYYTVKMGSGNINSYNTGITGLYNTKMILPKEYITTIGTGGGTAYGTPYVRNFRGGRGNVYNNRTYFLIRD